MLLRLPGTIAVTSSYESAPPGAERTTRSRSQTIARAGVRLEPVDGPLFIRPEAVEIGARVEIGETATMGLSPRARPDHSGFGAMGRTRSRSSAFHGSE